MNKRVLIRILHWLVAPYLFTKWCALLWTSLHHSIYQYCELVILKSKRVWKRYRNVSKIFREIWKLRPAAGTSNLRCKFGQFNRIKKLLWNKTRCKSTSLMNYSFWIWRWFDHCKEDFNLGFGPAQDVTYALIFRYVSKIVYLL